MVLFACHVYDGTIVGVSLDRYFLDKVADRMIELNDGIIREYPGGFSYFDQRRGRGTELTLPAPSMSRRRGGTR